MPHPVLEKTGNERLVWQPRSWVKLIRFSETEAGERFAPSLLLLALNSTRSESSVSEGSFTLPDSGEVGGDAPMSVRWL